MEQKKTLIKSFEKINKKQKKKKNKQVYKKKKEKKEKKQTNPPPQDVSTFITIFETSQTFLEQYVNKQILTVFPIVLSSYIGLILAIGRFFKYDDKNEKIIKLIEKYSFIINKFRQKSDNFEGFDFKLKDMKKWEELLDRDEKDNIGDILLKANEEKDLVLKPKEAVFYKKKYTKTRLKEIIEGKNFNELGDLINKDEHPNVEITKFTQNIIVKRNFCKYYCCFQWLCYERDYVDYDKTMLKNAIFFLKTNEMEDKDISNNKQPTNQSNNENKELKEWKRIVDEKITTLQMENENGKRREKIRAEEERKRQKKEHRLDDLRNTKMKSTSPRRSYRTMRKSTAKRDWEEKELRRKGRRGKHQEDPLDNLSDEEDQEVSDANIPILLGDKVREEKEETIKEEVEELPRVQKKIDKIRRNRQDKEEREGRLVEETIQENSECVIDFLLPIQEDISNNITLDISENYKVVPGTHAQKLKVWANAQFFKSYGRKAIHPDEITRFLEEKGQPDDESLDEFFAEERV